MNLGYHETLQRYGDLFHDLQKGKETLIGMLQHRMMVPGNQDIPISPTTIGSMKNISVEKNQEGGE